MNGIKPQRSYRYLIIPIAALLFALLLIGLFPRLKQWRIIDGIAEEEHIPSVNVMIARPETNPIELKLPGSTTPIRTTPIWSRSTGYLSKLYVDIGDRVQEGDILAEIETPEIEKQLLQAQADLVTAMAKLDIAAISSKRWEGLYTRNPLAVPLQEVDERSTSLRAAQGDVEAAQANVERLQKVLGFNKINAPFHGRITERNVDQGSLITAGSNGSPQKLFNISQTDILRIFVAVPQPYFRLIHDQLPADVTIREFQDHIFKGVVARNAGALDPQARTLLTEVHIDNRDGKLVPGLYVDVRFSLMPDAEYFVVPTKALIIRNSSPMVALVDEKDTISLVPVRLGRDWGKTIEIIAGIKTNDRLVTNPTEKIREGVQVTVTSQ